MTDLEIAQNVAAIEQRLPAQALEERLKLTLLVGEITRVLVEREEVLAALANLSMQVERHFQHGLLSEWLPDHACAECVPFGESIREGFQCGRHEAIAVIAKAVR